MSYYNDIYLKRLNRYGENRQTRLEGARRANFEAFLKQSPHYTIFSYGEEDIECVFEPFKQSESKNQMYLLARADQIFSIGDIVTITNDPYMFFYLDERKYSGYSRYVMLRLNHEITWYNKNKKVNKKLAFLYSKMIDIKNTARGQKIGKGSLYLENSTDFFLIMPSEPVMDIGDYLTVKSGEKDQFFRVKGFDYVTTPGIMYVTIDPTYERDLTPIEQVESDTEEDFFWLQGYGLSTKSASAPPLEGSDSEGEEEEEEEND